MKQIVLDDFSGGQNEVLMPREFGPGQWNRLIGLIANEDGRVETQPAIQRIGSYPANDFFYKIHAIVTHVGTYLIAITRLGRIYWAPAPDATATYATANAVTWTQLTTAQNYVWSLDGASNIQATISDNPYYKFVCDLPVRAYLYTRVPSATTGQKPDVSYDTDAANQGREFPGVLINNRYNGTAQAIVVYVNTITNTVQALVFPNMRRVPTYETSINSKEANGPDRKLHFINGLFLDGKSYSYGAQAAGMTELWPFSLSSGVSSVSRHPFSYTNVRGANLSGTGIIPRANVGCSIEGKLILGDIEWRQSADSLPTVDVDPVTLGSVEGTSPQLIDWKTEEGLLPKGRVVYNNGPDKVFLAKDSTATTGQQRGVKTAQKGALARADSGGSYANTCKLILKGTPPTDGGFSGVKVIGVGPNFNGTFTVSSDNVELNGNTLTYTFNRGGSYPTTITQGPRSGKVIFYTTSSEAEIELKPGAYAALPNDSAWDDFYAFCENNESSAVLAGLPDRLVARHFLNDGNTGRVANGIYFSIADIDQFNPTGEFTISRGGAPIAGMHAIDSTIVAITEGGGESDGVYRIRGSFTLAGLDDPTALRVELIKGGVGIPLNTEYFTNNPRRSCLWPDASTVVFVDRLGGVYTTDGNSCDRIDRFGPTVPTRVGFTSIAAVGKHLFMSRASLAGGSGENNLSLMCFTITRSDGQTAQGVWTEISLCKNMQISAGSPPAGTDSHLTVGGRTLYTDRRLLAFDMAAGQDDLYFIGVYDNPTSQPISGGWTNGSASYEQAAGGHVYRLALNGPTAERGRIDNVPVMQIVQTPTLGSDTDYETTNWHAIATGFVARGGLSLWGWYVGKESFSDGIGTIFPTTNSAPYATRDFTADSGRLQQYKQDGKLGQSRMLSYRLFFSGDVVFQSFSAWTTGSSPVDGVQR